MKIILILSLLLITIQTSAVTITQKGRYIVSCSDVLISEHNTYRKALEVAINDLTGDCRIDPPFVVVTEKQWLNASSADPTSPPVDADPVASSIELTWDTPTRREDGSDLTIVEIKNYNIYMGTDQNNLVLMATPLAGSNTKTFVELAVGTYYFSISTVDSDGVEGAQSAIIQQSL